MLGKSLGHFSETLACIFICVLVGDGNDGQGPDAVSDIRRRMTCNLYIEINDRLGIIKQGRHF